MDSCINFVYLFVYACFTLCEPSVQYDSKYGYDKMTDTVTLEQIPGNSYELFPGSYSIRFDYGGERVYFDLTKDDRTSRSLNPSVFRLASFLPGDLMNEDNYKEFAYYCTEKDAATTNKAGFVLHRTTTDTNAKVFGSFYIDGGKYHIEHVLDNDHVVSRAIEGGTSRRDVDESTNIIEVFVWSAPDVFRFHKTRLDASPSVVEEFLRTWERAIIRDVDIILKGMYVTDIRAYYVGGGNDRSINVDWYSDHVQDNTMRDNALSSVQTVLQELVQTDVLPNYDHAVVLTRANLAENFNGKGDDKIAFGIDNSLCAGTAGSSVSLAEVSSPFFVKAVAQSIIFSLGIGFTGIDSSYTVMSRSVDTDIPESQKAGRWTVDGSSQTRINRAIDDLDTNCLLVENDATNFTTFIRTPSYGALLPTLDEQCKVFVGTSSKTCRLKNTTCYNDVKCLDGQGICTVDYFTGDLTPCGDKSVCRYGECSTEAYTTTLAPPTTTTGIGMSGMGTTTPVPTTTTTTTTPVPTTTTTVLNQQSSTTPEPVDCCCERRAPGVVEAKMEYEPPCS